MEGAFETSRIIIVVVVVYHYLHISNYFLGLKMYLLALC